MEGSRDEVLAKLIRQGPAHAPGVQIDDHRQIQPAFPGSNIRNVAGPNLIESRGREVAVQDVLGHWVDRCSTGQTSFSQGSGKGPEYGPSPDVVEIVFVFSVGSGCLGGSQERISLR